MINLFVALTRYGCCLIGAATPTSIPCFKNVGQGSNITKQARAYQKRIDWLRDVNTREPHHVIGLTQSLFQCHLSLTELHCKMVQNKLLCVYLICSSGWILFYALHRFALRGERGRGNIGTLAWTQRIVGIFACWGTNDASFWIFSVFALMHL